MCESRKVGGQGVNGNVNLRFNESARLELGTDCHDSRFECNLKESHSHILIGIKSGSLLSHQLTEQEILDANLSIPFFSPELQIWRRPLSDKLIITGSVGVNKELVELTSTYSTQVKNPNKSY